MSALRKSFDVLKGRLHARAHKSVVFRTLFIRYPQIGGGIMSAFKAAGADYFAQSQMDKKTFEEKGFNARRNFLFALLGFTHGGFINYFVHSFLNPKLFGDNTRPFTIVKIILWNQLIYTPGFAFPLFYGYKGLVYSNGDITAAKDSIKLFYTQNIWHDVPMAMKVWGPAHIVTYSLIPRRYRVYWINFVSFAWTTILSTVRGNEHNSDTAEAVLMSGDEVEQEHEKEFHSGHDVTVTIKVKEKVHHAPDLTTEESAIYTAKEIDEELEEMKKIQKLHEKLHEEFEKELQKHHSIKSIKSITINTKDILLDDSDNDGIDNIGINSNNIDANNKILDPGNDISPLLKTNGKSSIKHKNKNNSED